MLDVVGDVRDRRARRWVLVRPGLEARADRVAVTAVQVLQSGDLGAPQRRRDGCG
ncbi:MAG: hypothetical protein AAFU70_13980 [Planctomycetota bacterium]